MYIYGYLVKRNLGVSTKAFLNEGKVSSDPVGMFHSSLIWSYAQFAVNGFVLTDQYPVLQLLMPLVVSCLNGGQSFGILSLPPPMRNIQKLQPHTLR